MFEMRSEAEGIREEPSKQERNAIVETQRYK